MTQLKTILFFILLISFPRQSYAVNFYDGARAPKGLYFLTYTSYYYADKTTDSKAKTAKADYEYSKFEELLRFCYYTPDLVLTAFFPAGYVHNGYYDVSSGGIGDINLGAGYFLPVKQADILPMLFVKFPTGVYDSGKSVNYGSNQYDIKPCLFLYKAVGRFSIDAAAKYYFRTENTGTKLTPGDELYLQLLFGWNISKICKAGPSFNWMKTENQKIDGVETRRSKKESFSLGGDFYLRLPIFSLTFTYLRDIRTKNTTKGDFFQVKTVRKF
ncbi:MAG: transporter [Candidatus Omnitrophota bacterium]|nr:transporter [Candidatus Omnitrophota bacterium]MBU1929642.1 transporter [Candidatus Omnitrophota bacterium]MBU2035402.1 transporter [Candidatus Omnitrophota bacterium]MBU2221938.1 transporter [Candidatus Omnitrophota bacterium]